MGNNRHLSPLLNSKNITFKYSFDFGKMIQGLMLLGKLLNQEIYIKVISK